MATLEQELEPGTIEDRDLEEEEIDDSDQGQCHVVGSPSRALCGAKLTGRRQHAKIWLDGRCDICHRPTCDLCARIDRLRHTRL